MKSILILSVLALSICFATSKVFEVKFGRDSLPIQNSGGCKVEQWGEALQRMAQRFSDNGFNKFHVKIDECQDDPYVTFFLAAENKPTSNDYCIEKLAPVTFTYKRHCLLYALMRSCLVPIDPEIDQAIRKELQLDAEFQLSALISQRDENLSENDRRIKEAYISKAYSEQASQYTELRVSLYKRCQKDGHEECCAKGWCGVASPFSNEIKSSQLCSEKCQVLTSEKDGAQCTAKESLEIATYGIDIGALDLTVEERKLISHDNQYKDLAKRCRSECSIQEGKCIPNLSSEATQI